MDLALLLNPVPPERPRTPPPPLTFTGRRIKPPIDRPRSDRDARLQIVTLHDAGLSYSQIMQQILDTTTDAIRYALKHRITPQHKRSGRSPLLTRDEGNLLEAFVVSSKRARELIWKQLAKEVFGPNRPEIGADIVKNYLKRRGYNRRIALRKPLLSEANKTVRLAWAHEYIE